ncbi:MAG: sugar phosphate nucleotidyltransferase [Candidatus Nanohaloarchaea archaeon]
MAKKRVSLTLEEEMVEKVDSEAEKEDVNRSQMVEEMIQSYFRGRGIDTALVFCGDPEAKTLDLYEGKPVLGHILDHLGSEGISRVILLVGQNREEIESQFGSDHDGMAIEYVEEEDPQGTAAALQKVQNKVRSTFAALNGHVITDVDLQEMTEVHREEDSIATMALTTVESPARYGVARLKGRTILGFEEKPEPGDEPSRLINAGTYIFEPEIFSHLGHDSLEEVFADISGRSELSGYIYGGEWTDVGEE